MISKITKFCKEYEKDIILAIIIALTALTGFGLGRLSKMRENKTPIKIENFGAAAVESVQEAVFRATAPGKEKDSILGNKMFVASKNGAKYHYPWCPGARRIKDSNKIWFSSKKEAESAGYTPAKNCKGLK
ncbi:MAG TPA: hypothetical protein ENH22_00905 [Candidatus Campbellbacteria bacterium]|nr:hypothetical protein [Candidatus Campbellbacteria bacterium]